jgi:hypothetical protein
MKTNAKLVLGVATLVMAAGVAGYAARAARADGIPDTDALTYAGTLEDNTGTPLSGSKSIQVNVYPDATSATLACQSVKAIQNVNAGHFEVTMPPGCVTAMKGNPNAHVEVVVDDKSLSRSRIGAVPFAIEAARAGEATGALKAALDEKAAAASVPKVTEWTAFPLILKAGTTAFSPVLNPPAGQIVEKRRVGDALEVRVKIQLPASPPPGVLTVSGFGETFRGFAMRCGGLTTWQFPDFAVPSGYAGWAYGSGAAIYVATSAATGADASTLKDKVIEFTCSAPVEGWTTTTP